MPLESATYISDLNTSNPVGSTDKVQTLDDHVRLIKSTLKTTFPSVAGAVTATHAELNILDGVTLTFAQINDAALKSAANPFTGSCSFSQATLFGSGTARGGAGDITVSKASASAYLEDSNGGSDEKIWRITNVAGALEFHTRTDANGSGGMPLRISRSGTSLVGFFIGQGTGECEMKVTTFDVDATNLELQGTVTTPNTSAQEVGFRGAPQNAQNSDYTLVLTDAGKTIYKASGGAGETITIPANSGGVAFPVGTIIRIVNNGGGDLTIAITSDTLSLAGVGTTGSRTLGDHGVAVIEKVASTEWFISGVGLT